MIDFDSLFGDHWHFGAHASELSNPGDFIKYHFTGKDVVIYNDGKEIIAFDNVCPHRGAKFFSTRRGNSKAVCKYHGLTISDGLLYMPGENGHRKCPERYNKYYIDYCGSFVFFSISPKESLYEQLGPDIYELIEAISFDAQQLVDVNEYNFECNALVAIENALEPDHVPFIHRDTLSPLNLENYKNEFYGRNSIVKFDIGNARIKNGLDKFARYFDCGSQKFDGYMSIHLYPFGFISSTYGYSYSIQNFFPSIEKDLSHFSSRLYFSPARPLVNSSIIQSFIESTISINRKIFDEDHGICKNISFADWLSLIDGPLSDSEVKILNFRKNIRSI